MKMKYSIALAGEVHQQAANHLIRNDMQEDLCFAIWFPSQGKQRKSALIQRLILPLDGERNVHGNVSFNSNYLARAIQEARNADGGLAFLHSHPYPGWQNMSPDDIVAEQRIAPAANGATHLPVVGMTIGSDQSWSGRFWERTGPRKYERQWCSAVRVVADKLLVTFNERITIHPRFKLKLKRTVSAWGEEAQENLARLKVGVIGTGSVGSLVAETLARMGIAQIVLLDFDSIEEHNLGTLLHGSEKDAEAKRAKVESLAHALKLSATSNPFIVEPNEFSVVEEDGFRTALDCDVLFSCVDRPWPRQVLNFIAYAHLIPVVDGGLIAEIQKNGRGLKRADWRAHVVAPGRRCLECLQQFDPGLVSVERDGYLDDPNYIAGLPDNHTLKRNENVFAFSMNLASLEVLQFLKMVIPSPGLSNIGAQRYHFVTGSLDAEINGCNPNCPYEEMTAKGEKTGFLLTGKHLIAEKMRSQRREQTQIAPKQTRWWLTVWRWVLRRFQ